jgi:quercetin dioxygenase-like cupin family protein
MAEARLRDGVPITGGWFVVNARDAPWEHDELRSRCRFGGEGEAHFDDLGMALYWLRPGQAMSMYHHEAGQEDFLVLRGRCLAIVEGAERELGPLDLLHCPPHTPHTMVATGDEPALVVAVGARKERGSARYPVDPAAIRHGAGVTEPASSPSEAYAAFSPAVRGPAPEGL